MARERMHETYAQRALRKIAHEGRTVAEIAADAEAMVRRERINGRDYDSIIAEMDRVAARKYDMIGRLNTKKAAERMAYLTGEQLVLDMVYHMFMLIGGRDDALA